MNPVIDIEICKPNFEGSKKITDPDPKDKKNPRVRTLDRIRIPSRIRINCFTSIVELAVAVPRLHIAGSMFYL